MKNIGDSRKARVNQQSYESAFRKDKNGLLIPRPDALPLSRWVKEFVRVGNVDNGSMLKRVSQIHRRTDVAFSCNPEGNTPVLGAGHHLFGARPLAGVKVKDLPKAVVEKSEELRQRAKKIRSYNSELCNLIYNLEVPNGDEKLALLKKVELDQMLTGGGYDNNEIGDITKSTMNFIITSHSLPDLQDTVQSARVMQAIIELRNAFEDAGLRRGSLSPHRISKVRYDQSTDGMIGAYLYENSQKEYTMELAKRLSITSGVDTTDLVGQRCNDVVTGETIKKARVREALEDTLSKMTFIAGEQSNIIVDLARIQKHGYKPVKNANYDSLEPKEGKGRSVSPAPALEGALEAMVFSAFNEALQKAKFPYIPSLFDKPTRVSMIREWMERIVPEWQVLSADWSAYDSTLQGSVMASILIYAIAPFFQRQYESWFWAIAYLYCFKVKVINHDLAKINKEEYDEVMKIPHEEAKGLLFFGCLNGLVSGLKGTHIMGSSYGLVVVHRCIPRELGVEPDQKAGAQAGDDTGMTLPGAFVKDTMEETFEPIQEAAGKYGLKMNVGKQIFHKDSSGELVFVFLQESYHVKLNIWGVGSPARYAASMFFCERDKELSETEEMLAIHARANQGSDNPFDIIPVTKFWLEKEQVLCKLYQDHGVKAWDMICANVGSSLEEVFNKLSDLGVGSFTFGQDKTTFLHEGVLPIVPIIAEVAQQIDLTSVRKSVATRVNRVKQVAEEVWSKNSSDSGIGQPEETDGESLAS